MAWLVRNHLVMSRFAFKRDSEDPKTISDFVSIVQSPERLKLLLVLTVTDIRAVGPNVWNGWKGQLLRELYLEAGAAMATGDPQGRRAQRIGRAKEKLADALQRLPEGPWPADAVDGATYDGPVLWVGGARSPYITADHVAAMDGYFPGNRRVTVKDAGHWVHSEQPAIFVQVLRAFLSEV